MRTLDQTETGGEAGGERNVISEATSQGNGRVQRVEHSTRQATSSLPKPVCETKRARWAHRDFI